MEAVRKSWTDDRLDHLNDKVDEGFAQVNARLDRLEGRFDGLEGRFDRLEGKFDRLALALIATFGSLFGTMLIASAGFLASQL